MALNAKEVAFVNALYNAAANKGSAAVQAAIVKVSAIPNRNEGMNFLLSKLRAYRPPLVSKLMITKTAAANVGSRAGSSQAAHVAPTQAAKPSAPTAAQVRADTAKKVKAIKFFGQIAINNTMTNDALRAQTIQKYRASIAVERNAQVKAALQVIVNKMVAVTKKRVTGFVVAATIAKNEFDKAKASRAYRDTLIVKMQKRIAANPNDSAAKRALTILNQMSYETTAANINASTGQDIPPVDYTEEGTLAPPAEETATSTVETHPGEMVSEDYTEMDQSDPYPTTYEQTTTQVPFDFNVPGGGGETVSQPQAVPFDYDPTPGGEIVPYQNGGEVPAEGEGEGIGAGLLLAAGALVLPFILGG